MVISLLIVLGNNAQSSCGDGLDKPSEGGLDGGLFVACGYCRYNFTAK